MPRNTTLAALVLVPLLLTACGTPQERCIARHTREYRNVSNLLAEVESNLARGYAWEEEQVVRERLTTCRHILRDKEGNVEILHRPCWRDKVETRRYRVPVDPVAEERKRDGLAKRLSELGEETRAYVAACKRTYPEEEGGQTSKSSS